MPDYAAAHYPLRGEAVDVRELGRTPLILPSTHHGLQVLVESLAARYGFALDIALECDCSISITKRLVLENCGCTVLPTAAVVEEVASGRLKRFRLENPPIERAVGIVWPENRVMPDGLWHVANIVRERAAALISRGAWPDAAMPENPCVEAALDPA
jgi:LysR family nitrogen assimilation transcriptional regulator